MRTSSNESWIRRLKKPGTVLLFFATAGLVLLAALMWLKFYPAMQEHEQASRQLAAVRQIHDNLRNAPLPEPFDADEARRLLRLVPAEEHVSTLLRSLLEVQVNSGVELTHLERMEERAEWTKLLQQLEDAQQEVPGRMSPPIGSDAGPLAPQQTGDGAPPDGAIAETRYMLSVRGTHEQVIAFWRGIAALERLSRVDTWSYTGVPLRRQADAATSSPEMGYLLTLELVFFTAPGFSQLEDNL